MIATVQSTIGGYAGAELRLNIDDAEHDRRRTAGIGVITGHGFGGLDHLMALPHGLPVPLDTLTRYQRAYVRRAPAGVCTTADGHVTRHAVRPCRVELATVRYDTTYRMALDSASRFAPFCARQVVVKRLPRSAFDRIDVQSEFDFYGIGIVLEHPDGTHEAVVEPRPWRPMRHTPAGWWFAERAYAEFLDQQASPLAPASSAGEQLYE